MASNCIVSVSHLYGGDDYTVLSVDCVSSGTLLASEAS